ncbi:hypothetical protein TNCV_4548191 [Trichonephila clavipes]|nr:hypothetical protein TNCV_4548191 [Trichonephila clavipes]
MSPQSIEQTTASPKVNFWEERARKLRELQKAAKAEVARSVTVPATPARVSTPPPVSVVPAPRTRPAPTPASQLSTSVNNINHNSNG